MKDRRVGDAYCTAIHCLLEQKESVFGELYKCAESIAHKTVVL